MEGLQRLQAGACELNDERHEQPLSRQHEPGVQTWVHTAGRLGASPAQATKIIQSLASRPGLDNSRVTTTTLVITRSRDGYIIPEEFSQRVADEIPDAELIILPPGDPLVIGLGLDDLLAEVTHYLTGEAQLPPSERQLAVIVFTDLVGSTRRAAPAGDLNGGDSWIATRS